MFTLTVPFAYISATLDEQKQPFKIVAGRPLELCYAVAVWDGEQDRPTIEKLYQRWLNFRANEPENFYDDVRELRRVTTSPNEALHRFWGNREIAKERNRENRGIK